jgi:hypothetical protein
MTVEERYAGTDEYRWFLEGDPVFEPSTPDISPVDDEIDIITHRPSSSVPPAAATVVFGAPMGEHWLMSNHGKH